MFRFIFFLTLLISGTAIAQPNCNENQFDGNVTYNFVSDNSGNTYRTVLIGGREWFAENLRAFRYLNGDTITQVSSITPDENLLKNGAWSYYSDSSQLDCSRGKLYNFYTVVDERGLCPSGFRVASFYDWEQLIQSIGGASNGLNLMETGSSHWANSNPGATNSTGFTAVPAGVIDGNGDLWQLDTETYWWTASFGTNTINQYTSQNFFTKRLGSSNGYLYTLGDPNLRNLQSIRCVRTDTTVNHKPVLSPLVIDSVGLYSVRINSDISNDGGLPIRVRGIVVGTDSTVTLNTSFRTMDGSTIGPDATIIHDLEPNTIYYARLYAGNDDEIVFGEPAQFTTETVQISLPSYIPASGNKGYWPFNGNADDESGNERHGTVYGPQLTTDRFGNPSSAYQFGTSEYIATSLTHLSSPTLTIAAWAKTSSSQMEMTLASARGGSITGLYYNANQVVGTFGNSGGGFHNGDYSNSPSNDGNWHHVAMSYNDTTIRIYFDGAVVVDAPINFDLYFNGPFEFGRDNPYGRYFNGDLDDIGLWDRALSTEEIYQLYQAQCALDVVIAPVTTVGCEGDTIPLIATSNASCQYQWFKDELLQSSATDSTLSVFASGVYTIRVNGDFCIAEDSIQITQLQLPQMDAGPDQIIDAGNSVTLSASGATSYAWSNGIQDGVAFTPDTSTHYVVTGTGTNGCSGSDSVLVTIIPSYLPSSGLQGYWPFNGNANDESGNQRHGVVYGPLLAADRFGNPSSAYQFGTSKYITTSLTNLSSPTLTIAAWAKTSSSQMEMTLASARGGSITGLYYNANQVVGTFGNSGGGFHNGDYSNSPSNDGNWHHVAMSYNDTTIRIYFDGAVVVDAPINFDLYFNGPFEFGRDNPYGRYFNGDLDDIGLWDRALSTEEIYQLYQAQCSLNVSLNAGSATPYCLGDTVALLASTNGISQYEWSRDGQFILATTDSVFHATQSGTYSVKALSGVCLAYDTLTISINSLPPVNAGSDQNVCVGSSIILAGSGATSYTWDNGVLNGVAFTPVSTGSYVLTGTDANGCTNNDTLLVTVNMLPLVNAGSDQIVCMGSSVVLAGSGATSYTWDNGVQNGIPFISSVSTNYVVIGTDGNGCSNTDTALVTVNMLPPVNAGPDQSICIGSGVTLSGSGALNYVWNYSVTDGVAFSPSITLAYTVTGTSTEGCTSSDQVIVIVYPLPTVFAGNDLSVCEGAAITLTGTGAATYTWDNGVTNGTVFNSPVGTSTYTVTGTSTEGCTSSDQVIITVNPLPTVFAGNDLSVCEGAETTLAGSGAATYTWDNGVQNGIPFIASVSTNYVVSGTDGNGCSNTDTILITTNPLPSMNAGTDQVVCQGSSVTLSGNSTVPSSWENGIQDGVAFVPSSTTNYIFTGTAANGCVNSDTVLVTVNMLPPVDAGSDQNICIGYTTTLTGSGATTYTWDNGVQDGVPFIPSAMISVIVTGTDLNGCTNQDTVDIQVADFTSPLVSTTPSDPGSCNGTGTVQTDPNGSFSISWSNGFDGSVVNGLCAGVVSVVVAETTYGCVYEAYGLVEENGTSYPLSTQISLNDASVDGLCDGTAEFFAYGGVSPYTYELFDASYSLIGSNPSISGLCSGVYKIYISDSQGTIDSTSFYIADPGNVYSSDPYADSSIVDTLFVDLLEDCIIDFETIDTVWVSQITYPNADTAIVTWAIQDINGIHYIDRGYSITNLMGTFAVELVLFCPGKAPGDPFFKLYSQVYINAQTLNSGGENSSSGRIILFPNPADDLMTLLMDEARHEMYILSDSQGRTVLKGWLSGTQTQISMRELKSGSYVLQIGEDKIPIRVIKQ